MAVFDVDQWLSSLKSQYNIPEDAIPADEIKKGFLRQDAFSRRQQELDQRWKSNDEFREQLLASENKLRLVQQLEQNYGPAEQWSDALANAIAIQHPELNERSNVPQLSEIQNLIQNAVGQAVAPLHEKLTAAESQIRNVGTGAALMVDFMSEAPERWKERYKTPFPKKEFSEFFQRSGTGDPFLAFELFEKPHYEKYLADKHKADLEEAEKRGFQSAMSKHGITEVPLQSTQGMLTQSFKTPEIDPGTGQPRQDTAQPQSYEERKARVGAAYQRALDQAERGAGSTNNK